MSGSDDYVYGGARALVSLHAIHLQDFMHAWREAQNAAVVLPTSDSKNYRSLEALLRHTLKAARDYLVWLCKNLELGDPAVDSAPEIDDVVAAADDYVAHLIDRFSSPLRQVAAERFSNRIFSFYRSEMTAESLLEHAVMHPIRHAYQLRRLVAEQT